MLRHLTVLAAILILLLRPMAAGAQPTCELAPVFQPFQEAVGAEIVGECSAAASETAAGDLTQATTRGVLTHRPGDNVTTFANETTTWLAGPDGLQSRPNGERLSWETQPEAMATPPTPPQPSPAVPQQAPQQPSPQQPTPAPAAPSMAAREQRCSEIVNGAPDRGQPTRDQQWGICVNLAEQYGAPGVDCYAKATKDIAPNIGKISRETTNALFDASLKICKASIR